MLPQPPHIALFNHLLEKEPWARERLAPFAGAVVEARFGPIALRAAILSSGLVAGAPAGSATAAVVHLRPGTPEVSGEEPLAEALRFLAQHLRWDAEEDLSRLVGDVLAHRLVQGGRDFVAWQRDVGRRLAESGADYLARENGLLVTREELERLGMSVQDLHARIEALERRMGGLG